jgi:hypothetical protein
MSVMTYRSALLFGVVLLAATPCFAQKKSPVETPVAADFGQLREVVGPGSEVIVTDLKGNVIYGKIRSISTESVTVNPGGFRAKPYEMKRDEIQTVRHKPDSSATGAIAGALAGFGAALGIAAFGNEDTNHSWAFALIPIGGVGGYFADRASRDDRLLYAKSSSPKVSFDHALGGSLGVRADVGLVSPANHPPAPRVAANIVVSLGSGRKKNP